MEMNGDPPPLWPQLTNPMPRRRRPPPSPLFTSSVLIILLPIIALLLLFFAVPPFLSVATQIFRPNGVKKSWDSLNVFLVLFAVLCGVFARGNDDDGGGEGGGDGNIRNDGNSNKPNHHHVSQQWFDQYQERRIYDDPPMNAAAPATPAAASVRRLKRSSSSYPDLRQDSLWENGEDRFRFFDDFEIDKYRSSTNDYNDQVHELRRSLRREFEESEPKVIPVDTFIFPSSPPSKSPAPSTPPPPPAGHHKPRRTYQAVGREGNMVNQNCHVGFNESESPDSPQPVTPPPPPPPPPRRPPSPVVQMGNRSEQRYAKFERRKSNATKEIKMVFASLRKRKKKWKTKHRDHQHEPPPYYSTTIPPPSPPPPPPPMPPSPSSVFQKYNLFRSKGSKSKKIHSVPAPPPPPPPPPPTFSVSKRSSKENTQIPPTPPPAPPPTFFPTKTLQKQKSQIPPPSKPPPAPPTPPLEPSRRRNTANSSRPPLPTKSNTSIYYDENVNSGGQSPLTPKPPPPPPFKMPEFKLAFRGDFVKIRSSPSSHCSSPDLEEVDVSSIKDDDETIRMTDGDDGAGAAVGGVPVFCPSPDVNAKAETFIARLRDGWKLEKINSMKEKQRIYII